MEGPSDPLERLMQAFDCSLCSETFRDAVCFPTTCGHYFCRECVIATLEGPGISKSECPVCHKPGWKNDLKVSYTVNNALVHAAGLRAEVQRGREAEARLRQRRGSGVQHAAAGAASGPSRPGSADPGAAAGRRLSHGEAGSSAGKRKRRGRSVPEQQEASGACAADGRQEQQAMLQPPADGQQQQEGAGWRERQPQRLWGRKKTPAPPAAPQAQQQRQQQQPPLRPPTASAPAARGAAKSDVTAAAAAMGAAGQGAPLQSAAAAAGEVPESPVPVLYDSDWEEQARAAPMGPATPEAIAALEAEVALLQQAIQLCDELPCLGGSAQRLPQQAEAGAAEEGAGAAGAAGTAAHVQQQPQQQQPPESQRAPLNEGQDVVIVPDTEEGSLQPSPPKPASAAAADSPGPAAACTAAAGQAAPQQQHGAAGAESASQQAQQAQRRQQRQDEQQPPQQQDDRKRRLSELQAAQAQQRALREGLTQEMEDEEGHRMSGRKRRKGGSGRAAPGSSRLGRPGDSAAKASTGAGASAPAQVQPAVQPVQQAAQQQGQHGAAQEPGRLSKTAAGDGDAVEVMWQVEGQLVPYVGRVLDVLPEGKHRIEYLDGEVATQDLDEEQWRLLLQEEYDEAEAEYQWQQQQASSSGDEFQLSSGSEGMHSGSQVSEAVASEEQLFQAAPQPAARPQALQQQQHVPRQRQPPKQQAKPSAARKRPLVPPPKFNQEPAQQAQQAQQLPQGSEQQMPEWLRQDPSSKSEQQHGWQQASEAAAQQFGRKHKEAGVSLEGQPTSGTVCPSSPEPEELLDGNEGQLAATAAAPAAAAAAAEGAAGTPGGSSRRCIAVSGLTNEIQQKLLTLRARLGGLTLEEQVSERTTHVLVPMDDRCCVKQRSMQYLLALAHGCWVVGHGWVDACLEAGHWLPERQYEARGLADMKGSLLVPAAARQRHAPGGGGGPGLFAGRRVFLTAPPAGSGGSRSNSTGSASKVALVAQMVAAEGGSLVRALGQGEGGGGRGAASPSPSPEGATLVVCLAQGPQEARLALKMGQKRYPGRLLHHQSWIFDSLCCGRCLDPADYVMTEQRPLPTGARLSLSQQPSQASASQV
ncbi:hypothetical protein C2E21_5041 [Chlorella sorokiniana]|uniref:RING-type E3 ubiquitin transferase BRCA1 n=1 Tax=Chlorella sorokiniana TaxID=3076 RepID=A0A2P6TQ73_CHLSO|nr:hypothetical protein C2E21_5041 [Chlorella sorokiniana]|eukprot:PRW56179.1 hypothetical protein C2E21_5041 [Chlorella sorokiniana]